MSKKIKVLLAVLVLLCSTSAFAKDFDWSQCWCNYGGGIKEGDFIVNVDAGLYFSDFAYSAYDGYWFLPPLMVDVQYAKPIWKLPFTFGGYAGVRAFGYNNRYYNTSTGVYVNNVYTRWILFAGAEAAYHVMLPPDGLDVYAVNRIGFNIPFANVSTNYSLLDIFEINYALGANWFFNDSFGLNLELGAPISKFGVTFKF